MHKNVLTFWFEELEPSQWWVKDPDLDEMINQRFSDLHASANRCELFKWRETARGRLAEVIVLDQFSRNIFRDHAKSFASDPLALALAQEAIALGHDQSLTAVERSFLYLPFMHSESVEIHEVALALYKANGVESNLDFERKHKAIIDKFGRYPHRNEIFGRESTPAEIEFLKQPGSSF